MMDIPTTRTRKWMCYLLEMCQQGMQRYYYYYILLPYPPIRRTEPSNIRFVSNISKRTREETMSMLTFYWNISWSYMTSPRAMCEACIQFFLNCICALWILRTVLRLFHCYFNYLRYFILQYKCTDNCVYILFYCNIWDSLIE